MKKMKLIVAATLFISLLAACGSEKDTQTRSQDEISNQGSTEINTPTPSTEQEEQEEQENESLNNEPVLSDLENYMLNEGMLSGDKIEMAADMVGATAGVKYADCNTEIYEYDINSEKYISLSNGEEIELEGMPGFTVKAVSINGKFVLMGDPSQEVIDCFNSFH